MSEVTRILDAMGQGDARAADELLPIVYDELRRLAAHRLSREKPGQTLQATALVHEAYLRLVGDEDPGWKGRGHFFGAAAEAMRRILIERARAKGRIKRGGDRQRVDVDPDELAGGADAIDLLDLNEALTALAEHDPVDAELVKLRYFAGLGAEEAAEALGIAPRTARRRWNYARAWLLRRLDPGQAPPG